MSAHDRYLAQYSNQPVIVECAICSFTWSDVLEKEYGASWLQYHEDCQNCGASGDDLRVSDDEYEPDYEPDDWYEYEDWEPWT